MPQVLFILTVKKSIKEFHRDYITAKSKSGILTKKLMINPVLKGYKTENLQLRWLKK